jgi:enoyl-CoA hydratase/carnithine racemase
MNVELEHIVVEEEEGIARITLDRPERRNAVDYPAASELDAATQLLADDLDVRLVAIQGAGPSFCSGIDLKELSAGELPFEYFEVWERALRRLETMDALVLCLVHGHAAGGGLQLALASDIRVATPTAEMWLPAIREGIIPGLGTWRLARYVGMGRAKKMTLLGNRVDGEEARRIGLADHLVDEETARGEFDDLIERYMRGNSAGCRLSKLMVNEALDHDFEPFLEAYLERQRQAVDSDDFEEAAAAYREDRQPEWA